MKNEKPSMGESMDIFWNYTFRAQSSAVGKRKAQEIKRTSSTESFRCVYSGDN